MALRKLGGLIRISTKAGLAGGAVYLYYDAGLWKGTDESIENYEKLRKQIQTTVNANPDVKKWSEYITSSVSSGVKPYSQAIADFRKEWLDFDFSRVSSPVNGIIKPAWNKGVSWTAEAIADLPDNIPKWGSSGIQKLTELTQQPSSEPKIKVAESPRIQKVKPDKTPSKFE